MSLLATGCRVAGEGPTLEQHIPNEDVLTIYTIAVGWLGQKIYNTCDNIIDRELSGLTACVL